VSAATSEWPGWLRRHTAVELLGEPGRFFAWLTIALSLLTIAYVGGWNAAKYPVPLGYDSAPNAAYMHVLLDQHHIPRAEQSAESNQPPAYYLLAGVAARAGHKIFGWLEARPFTAQLPEASYRGAQIFNVCLVLLTALCILWLARLVAPDRPWVWAASVGFFAFLPVVSKTAAMIHPENLNMLTSAVAVTTTTHMLVRRTFAVRWLALLAAALALGLATRASTIFVLLAVAVGVVLALRVRELRALVPWRHVGTAALVLVVLALPWVGYRAVVHHQGPFTGGSQLLNGALHPHRHTLSDRLTSHARFFRLAEPKVLTTPWRSHYINEAFPQTYTDMWGDWLAAMAWSAYDPAPSPAAQAVLKDQSYIGLLPTGLSIAGWLGLATIAFRRRPELVTLAVLPLFTVGGYLYRSWITLTHDGDLLKAIYALNSVTTWALGFGLATVWLGSRSRLARYAMVALFAIFAVLELRFTMYGVRDGQPIF
jgi:4-amino-4-deoxy-L-arabinose transferase-like glycosyltransferase